MLPSFRDIAVLQPTKEAFAWFSSPWARIGRLSYIVQPVIVGCHWADAVRGVGEIQRCEHASSNGMFFQRRS